MNWVKDLVKDLRHTWAMWKETRHRTKLSHMSLSEFLEYFKAREEKLWKS